MKKAQPKKLDMRMNKMILSDIIDKLAKNKIERDVLIFGVAYEYNLLFGLKIRLNPMKVVMHR